MASSPLTEIPSVRSSLAVGDCRHLAVLLAESGYKHPLADPTQGPWHPVANNLESIAALIGAAKCVASSPVPTEFKGSRLDPSLLGGVGKRLQFVLGSLEEVISGSINDLDWRSFCSEAAMTPEPFLVKLFMLINPQKLIELLQKKPNPGLSTLIVAMHKCHFSPIEDELLKLSDCEFRGLEGWNERSTLSNAVRDVLASRNSFSHLAPNTGPDEAIRAGYCSIIFILAFVEHNRKAITEKLTVQRQVIDPVSEREYRVPQIPKPPADLLKISITRDEASLQFRDLMNEAICSGNGAHFEVSGPPGWGKSHFIAKAISHSEIQARYVDLLDCYDMCDVASTLLRGISVSDHEINRIDKAPMTAVSVLAENSLPNSVVVFGNCHAADHSVQSNLPRLIKRLTDKGFVVVTEGWSHIRGCAPQHRAQLDPLLLSEVVHWAGIVLHRFPNNTTETPCLEHLEGYPALVESTLHTMRSVFPDGYGSQDSIADLILENMEYFEFQEEWIDFATQGVNVIGPIGDLAPRCLLSALAISPWGTLSREKLDSDTNRKLERLLPLHLIKQVAGGTSWERLPALWPLAHNALKSEQPLSTKTIQLAKWLAGSTPVTRVDQSKRHCVSLYARGLIDVDTRNVILSAHPVVGSTDPETNDVYLAPSAIAKSDLILDVLPLESQITVIEGQLRRNANINNPDVQRELVKLLDSFSDQNIQAGTLVRDIHRILLRSGTLEQKLENYQRFFENVSSEEAHSVGGGQWYAQILASASENAARLGELEQARAWQSRAQEQLSLSNKKDGYYADLLTIDIQYRLVCTEFYHCANDRAMAEAHWEAMAFITSECPITQPRWLRCWMIHFSALTNLAGWSRELELILASSINNWPPSGAVADLLIQLVDLATAAKPIMASLKQTLKRRLHKRCVPEGSFEHQAMLLITDPSHSVSKMSSALRIAVEDTANSEQDSTDTDNVMLGAILVAICNYQPEVSHSHRADVRRIASTLISVASRGGLEHASTILQWSVDAVIRHESARLEEIIKTDNALTQSRFARTQILKIANRVTSILRKAATSCPGTSWPFLVERYMTFTSFARGCLTAPEQRDQYAQKNKRELLQFLRDLDATTTNSTFVFLTEYLIYRELWMFDEAVMSLSNFVDCKFTADSDIRFSDDMLIGLLPLFLDRPLLRSSISCGPDVQEKARSLFNRMVSCAARPLENEVFNQLLWVERVLKEEDKPAIWEKLLANFHLTIRNPIDFWEEVQRNIIVDSSDVNICKGELVTQSKEPTLLGDLTNPQILEIATLLATRGATSDTLPLVLRRALAEFALFAAIGLHSWIRSNRNGEKTSSRWRVGAALVIAISLNENEQIFGQSDSPVTRRRTGERKPWREMAFDYLSVNALGSFGDHVSEVTQKLRSMLQQTACRDRSDVK